VRAKEVGGRIITTWGWEDAKGFDAKVHWSYALKKGFEKIQKLTFAPRGRSSAGSPSVAARTWRDRWAGLQRGGLPDKRLQGRRAGAGQGRGRGRGHRAREGLARP
jgi:hypothetical protein